MDCENCQDYQDHFEVLPYYGIRGPEYHAVCPTCMHHTKIRIEFNPPEYRMMMD